jgi:hypothetical protein
MVAQRKYPEELRERAVKMASDYPTNPPPWNSNICFHLSDGTGRVAYPAVGANQMTPDPDGLNPGGDPPVATSKSCEGAIP